MDENMLKSLRQNKGLLANMILDTQQGITPSQSSNLPVLPNTKVANAPINNIDSQQPPSSYSPYQNVSHGESKSGSYNTYDILNAGERADALRRQEEANAKALEYNNSLPAAMAKLNSTITTRESDYDEDGKRIRDPYVPILPLPVMPEKIDIPNIQTASRGEAWSESKNDRVSRPAGPEKKIDTNIPLFFRDPNGKIRISWDDYGSTRAEKLSGDPVQTQWSDIADLRSMKKNWVSKQFRDEGKGLNNIWKIKTLSGSPNGKPVETEAKGNFFDIVRASALTDLAVSRPDAIRTKDRKPINQTSSQNLRLDQNKLFGTTTVKNEDGSTTKVQYISDRNAYPILIDGISNALSLNGWPDGSIPSGNLWANLTPGLQEAYKAIGGTPRGGVSRDQFVRAIFSHIISENQ